MGFTCLALTLMPYVISAAGMDLDTHPRPDWARPCETLNGSWLFDFDPQNVGEKEAWYSSHAFTKTIQVPFPWQSPLSGIGDTAYQGTAWYQRDVTIPLSMQGSRIFLVFGAVDWQATVYVNGIKAAAHEGGYLPFEVELTDRVKPGESASITVQAVDTTDGETLTGKQTGWYTQTGGIWQTVYLEARGQSYFAKGHVTPDIDAKTATFNCEIFAAQKGAYTAIITAQQDKWRSEIEQTVQCRAGLNSFTVVVPIEKVALWSPTTPVLYSSQLELKQGEKTLDTVITYFGMRKVSHGVYNGSPFEYILLNDKPLYLRGALHQSFNPQGVYTHPDDAFIQHDYATAKALGLNMLRIHIKVDEPRALYWADKLGVMLICDIPCFAKKTDRAKQLWEQTLRGTIARDFNHPAIIEWCDFNETWGIGDGKYDRPTQDWVRSMYQLTRSLDATRLAEDNSPCNYDHVETDVNSWHFYMDDWASAAKHVANVVEKTYPGSPFNYAQDWQQGTAPLINSEYGGVGAGSGDRDVAWVFLFLTNLLRKYDKIGGYVYTELSDIEWEHNGFMNYDRSMKSFPYPAGITVADLQQDEFPVLDCPPYQKEKAGLRVSIPILLSHWSDQTDLTLSMFADGQTVDGKPWTTWIHPVSRPVENAASYRVSPQGSFDITLPDACGILNVIVEVQKNGKRLAANYCVLDVREGAAWTEPNQFAVSIPVNRYARYQFTDAPIGKDGELHFRPGKVFGYGDGFVEYKLKLPRGLRATDIESCRLITEIGAKAKDERLDWPARKNPQDYPQTDGRQWPSDISVALNKVPVQEVAMEDDFADVQGVLSHVARYQHGSNGMLADLAVMGDAWNSLQHKLNWYHRYMPWANRTITLRYQVPKTARHCGGLSLYGNQMGAWPCDPTLVFTLKPGVAKPTGEVIFCDSAK